MSKTWINFASCALAWLVTTSHFLGWHSLSLQVDTVERGVGMCMESRFHCVLCFCFWGYIANSGVICHLPPFMGTRNNHWLGGSIFVTSLALIKITPEVQVFFPKISQRSIGWLDLTPWAGHLDDIWVSALVHWRWNQKKTGWILGKMQPWNQLVLNKLTFETAAFWSDRGICRETRCCSFDAFPPPEFVEILCRGRNLPCWEAQLSWVNFTRLKLIHPIIPMGCIKSSEKHLGNILFDLSTGVTFAWSSISINLFTLGCHWLCQCHWQ